MTIYGSFRFNPHQPNNGSPGHPPRASRSRPSTLETGCQFSLTKFFGRISSSISYALNSLVLRVSRIFSSQVPTATHAAPATPALGSLIKSPREHVVRTMVDSGAISPEVKKQVLDALKGARNLDDYQKQLLNILALHQNPDVRDALINVFSLPRTMSEQQLNQWESFSRNPRLGDSLKDRVGLFAMFLQATSQKKCSQSVIFSSLLVEKRRYGLRKMNDEDRYWLQKSFYEACKLSRSRFEQTLDPRVEKREIPAAEAQRLIDCSKDDRRFDEFVRRATALGLNQPQTS